MVLSIVNEEDSLLCFLINSIYLLSTAMLVSDVDRMFLTVPQNLAETWSEVVPAFKY
jgi:hypothetical protein